MKKNKKLIAIGCASLAAVAALTVGTFAFFTDTANEATNGTAGKVDIEVSEKPELSNFGNINPGDEDETLDASARLGTNHDLTFTVDNIGNKSVMTRNIITLTVNDESGNALDPSYYSLKSDDATELVKKYYSTDGVTFTASKPADVKYVRYITTQVALNGVGENAEDNDAVAVNTDAVKTNEAISAVDYDYILKLDKNTPDGAYELSKLTIDIEVQAMQYRNTTDAEWDTLFTHTVTQP